MQILHSDYINESVHYEKLTSGLDVYIMPKRHFAKKYAFFGTKYGGTHNTFKDESGKVVQMPNGIAHFLEHQIFEDDLESTFERFERIGANVNAYTSNGSTVYHVESVDQFDKALTMLMDFVLNVKISDASVEKEKEVIIQEIKMYEDEPEWLMGAQLLKNMYHNHPIREDIAGTVESVKQISKAQLLQCFESFYAPSNMTLFVFGDVDVEKTLQLIEENQPESFLARPKSPIIIFPDEPYEIKASNSILKRSVSKNNMIVGFKANPEIGSVNRELNLASLRVAGDLMFGKSSETFSRLYNKGMISEAFDMDVQFGPGYAYSVVGNQTNQIDALHHEIMSTVEYHLKNGFSEASFELMKRKLLGRFVASFNSLQSIAGNFTFKKMRGYDLFEQVEAFNKLKLDDINNAMALFYDLSNSSVSSLVKSSQNNDSGGLDE